MLRLGIVAAAVIGWLVVIVTIRLRLCVLGVYGR
jgi:hypothetical protein